MFIAGYHYDLESCYNLGYRRVDRNNVLFLWLNPTLQLGSERQLQLDDLPSLPEHMTSSYTMNIFLLALRRYRHASPVKASNYQPVKKSSRPYHISWLDQSSSTNSSNSTNNININRAMYEFITIIFHVHGNKFMKAGFIKLCGCLVSFLGPVLLGAMVSYIEGYEGSASTRSLSYGLCLVTLLGSSFIMAAVLNTCYNVRCSMMQSKINGMLMRLVYHRAIHLPSYAWNEDLQLSHDQVITLIQVDVNRVANICQSVHDLWTLPLEIITAFILLYVQVREAFFAGVVIIIIMIPINTIIAKRIGVSTKKMMVEKDHRVQILTEAVHHIKSVKMVGWEDVILSLASSYRTQELQHLSMRKYLDAICVFLWASMPVLVPFATFMTTALLGVTLTASKVFTTIALLNMLIFPMNAFPWVVNSFVEARVSLKRIVTICIGYEDDNMNDDMDDDKHQHNDKSDHDRNEHGVKADDRKMHLDFGYDIMQVHPYKRMMSSSIQVNYERNPILSPSSPTSMASNIIVSDMIWRISGRKNTATSSSTSSSSDSVNIMHQNHDDQEDFIIGPISLSLQQGSITAIIGSIASGKSSLLLGLLQEIRMIQGNHMNEMLKQQVNPYKLAICMQTPCLHSGMTIRENIILDQPYDASRYHHIMHGCGLDIDFQTSSSSPGDGLMLQPNSNNVSGGQRLRIGVARALYASTSFILLDDPFSALDITTARALCAFLIQEASSRGVTIILVTHHVRLLEHVPLIISLHHGKEVFRGSYSDLIQAQLSSTSSMLIDHPQLSNDSRAQHHDDNVIDKATDKHVQTQDDDTKTEKRKEGSIAGNVYVTYMHAIGYVMTIATVIITMLMQCTMNGMSYWLAYWVSHQASFTTSSFLIISGIIVTANIIFTVMRSYLFAYGTLRAAKFMHHQLIHAIFHSSLSFFEQTSLGRIINRIGKDTNTIDDELPFMLNIVLAQAFLLLGAVIVILYTDPIVIIMLIVVCLSYYRLQRFYRQSSRELRRLDAIYRSPLYAQLYDDLHDSVYIRAMKCTGHFETRYHHAVDNCLRVSRIVLLSSQWLSIRLQLLGSLLSSSLALSAVLCSVYQILPVSAALLGLSLSYSLTIVSNLNGLIGSCTETEKEMIAVERVVEYSHLPTEYDDLHDDEAIINIADDNDINSSSSYLYRPLLLLSSPVTVHHIRDKLSPSWPLSGAIVLDKVTMHYPGSSIPALYHISINIPPACRVAIIGRTGSGKSSLLRTLLRMNSSTSSSSLSSSYDEYSGSITIDGVELRGIPKHILRDRVSVIPQDPVIFTASLRFNIDPRKRYDDDRIMQVLSDCGLLDSLSSHMNQQHQRRGHKPEVMGVTDHSIISINDLRSSDASYNLTSSSFSSAMLDMILHDGGVTLSQGQKQLICLARVLLHPQRIILVDEATAAIDPVTETMVYRCLLKAAVEHHATVLCVCHKLDGARILCNHLLEMQDGEVTSFRAMT